MCCEANVLVLTFVYLPVVIKSTNYYITYYLYIEQWAIRFVHEKRRKVRTCSKAIQKPRKTLTSVYVISTSISFYVGGTFCGSSRFPLSNNLWFYPHKLKLNIIKTTRSELRRNIPDDDDDTIARRCFILGYIIFLCIIYCCFWL